MAIEWAYLEAQTLIDGLLKHVFRSISVNHRASLDHVKRQFPHNDLVFPEKTVTCNIHDRKSLLKEDGWTEDGQLLKRNPDGTRLSNSFDIFICDE